MPTIFEFAGFAAITYGVERVSVAAACIVGGVLVSGYGLLLDYLSNRRARKVDS